MENNIIKIMRNFNIYTDRVIEAQRQDIVVVKKDTKKCLVRDIAAPGDVRVGKEDEKCEKYRELSRELGKLWEARCTVTLVVVGALVILPQINYLGMLDISLSVDTV